MLVLSLLSMTALQPDPLDVYGTWLTEAGDSKVVIEDCGDGSPCGRIAWVDPEALDPAERGRVLRDRNNPDENLRDRTIIGLPLLRDFEAGGKRWRRGEIYDPEEGKTYRSTIARNDNGTLSLKGCVAIICLEQTWTSAPLTEKERAEAVIQAGE